jgi:hypothetical protein
MQTFLWIWLSCGAAVFMLWTVGDFYNSAHLHRSSWGAALFHWFGRGTIVLWFCVVLLPYAALTVVPDVMGFLRVRKRTDRHSTESTLESQDFESKN